MRLLHRKQNGDFGLTRELPEDERPRYGILSHTWLADNEEEVTFEDMERGIAKEKAAGYDKIRFCGDQAAKDGLEYFWVDTCCINKASSAELQEALTSMFFWYRKAAVCYVYLSDVLVFEAPDVDTDGQLLSASWESAFRQSKWFTRGWTLQELLASQSVEFFSAEGVRLGNKTSLEGWINEITRIPPQALQGHDLANFTVAERLSWSENRQTKRKEDRAYCLLGIFNIFMPLIYGEGDNALLRLQAEINKENADNARLDQYLSKLPIASEAAFNSQRNQHEPTCLPNTRSQLLEDIIAWADSSDERCIFWLNGIAGTGKSTIARTIARIYNDRGTLGASFFFSRGGGDLGNANKLVATLARQLATKVTPASRYICEAIRDHHDILGHSIQDQWSRLILDPLGKLAKNLVALQTVVLVIDALDECDSESDIRLILRALASTTSLSNIRLRIFITSRPEIPIRHSVGRIPETGRAVVVLHQISLDVVNQDLSLFFQSNFLILREERDFEPDDWPGKRIIDRLVEISCGLFIWASIAYRFIRGGKQMAMRRINTLIHGHRDRGGPEKQLDQIYTTVLQNAVQGYSADEKAHLYLMLNEVLGSIVILLSPLSMDSLANLLHKPSSDVRGSLGDLHTIFYIPDQTDNPIGLHHPTFRDFLLNKNRCSDLNFWVDEKNAHRALADNCLKLMSNMLKKDICGLVSPGVLLSEVDPSRIKQCIPPELQYACVYWVHHYRHSGVLFSDGDRVDKFFRKHFLHWLEAINLVGKSVEMSAIVRLYHALLDPSTNTRQIPFVKDARRFIFSFQSIIKESPLQTYCAGLAFIPSANQLRLHFQDQRHPWIKDVQVAEAILPYAKDEFNYVNDLSFSPDSTQIASGSQIVAARLWDSATGAALYKYVGPKDKVSSVAISPDGKLLAGGSDDFTVWVWDLKTRAVRFHIEKAHSGWVNSVAFSPDGNLLASGSMDETVALWDVATAQEVKRFDNQSSCVNYASFSPDGSLIATGSVDQMVRLWDISNTSKDLRTMFDGHFGPVNAVRFSPNGQQIISGADDLTIKLWDITKGAEIITFKGHTKKVMTVVFSLDAHFIVSGSEDMTVKVWDATTAALLHTLTDHTSGLNSVAFSPNGQLLASCSFDDEVRLWDTNTWTLRRKLDNFEDDADHVVPPALDMQQSSVSGFGEKIETIHSESTTLASKKLEAHSSRVTTVVFSPDGQLIASGSQDFTIKIWLKEGVERWKLEGHSGGINYLAFSPDGGLLASASIDTTVRLWNTATGASYPALQGHSNNIFISLFSPDGQLLASCSADKTILLWSTTTRAELARFVGHSDAVNNIAFSPDNRFLASCSADTTIILWDLSTKTALTALRGHSGPVNSVAFSLDGGLLVSCSEASEDPKDATIRLWRKSGEEIGSINSGGLRIDSAAISPNNKLVASCSVDEKTVRLWDSETQSARGVLEPRIAVRKVSFSSCGRYVETNQGVLDIGSFSSISPSLSLTRPHALFITQEWLTRDGENVIWLPEEFYPTDVTTRGKTIVLGHSSGAISFISV